MARFSLLTKLLLAILLPTVISFAGFAVLGHFAAARALEAELGRRLAGIAAVAATQISEESVALLASGDESSRTYRNLRRRLVEIRDAAGVARVYLFAADLTARVDTDEVPIGTRYYGLETSRTELRQVFGLPGGLAGGLAGGPADARTLPRSSSSLLFRGRDGRLYKSGYAPIAGAGGDGAEPVRFAVGVDGNAALYTDLLGLRKTLLYVGLGGVLTMVLLAVGFGLRLTRPLRRLRESARLIGSGVLDQPIDQSVDGSVDRRVDRPVGQPVDQPIDQQVDFAHSPTPARQRGGDEVAELAEGLEAMRQALRARDERMQMMLSGIAHEVRNPLGGMELFAGLLAEEIQPSSAIDIPTVQGYVQRIQKELRHLQAVVSDFLEYARRPRPQLSPTAIADLLAEVRDSVGATAAGVQVAVSAAPGLLVAADATQLRRALLNLAHNAVQACAAVPADDPRPRTVELSAQPAPDPRWVRVTVRDSGPGIPEAALPKIWAPFFTTRAQGTGLGLAFVREIVQDHGGQLDVKTGAAGTTFELTFLAAGAAASGKSSTAS